MDEQEAKEFFFKMNDVFNKIDLRYFLFLGTLLGAIRERGFIPIDLDLDVGVFKEEFDIKKNELKTLFEKNEFETKWKFHNTEDKIDNNASGLKIYSMEPMKGFKRQMHCDICCFTKIDNWIYYPRDNMNKILLYPEKVVGQLKEISFYNVKVKVPYETEEFLKLTYGENWKIPHKKFKAESGIHSQVSPKNGDEFWWRGIGVQGNIEKNDIL